MMNKNFYIMLIFNSPWPISCSLMCLNLFSSAILFFKFCEKFVVFNLFIIMVGSFMWWKDYSMELNLEGFDLMNSGTTLKNGMILFILSEVMLFFSIFWGYFHFFLNPELVVGSSWPPRMILMFDWLNIPMLNTLILVLSSVLLTMSHHNLYEGNFKICSMYLLFTIFSGLMFSFFQFMEYKNSFFCISDCNFGSIFFLLTGLHGMHVIIGSLFLFYIFIRLNNCMMSKSNFLGFDLSCWYWHFVDVVWIYVYYIIYFINSC